MAGRVGVWVGVFLVFPPHSRDSVLHIQIRREREKLDPRATFQGYEKATREWVRGEIIENHNHYRKMYQKFFDTPITRIVIE
jgi:hypothetical protein